jgi:LAO/AO transport system kinase
MEIADIFVVNKADRDGADRLVAAIESTLSLLMYEEGRWRPPIVQTVATAGRGIPGLLDAVAKFRMHQAAHAYASGTARQRARAEHRVRDLVARGFARCFEQQVPADAFDAAVDRVAARLEDPYSAADALVSRVIQRSAAGPAGGRS